VKTRTASSVIGAVTIVLFGITLLIQNIPAGPDIGTPRSLSTWLDIARISAPSTLGPFRLASPRLVEARCAPDGRRALLTFESPIIAQDTMVLMDFLATNPVSSEQQVVLTTTGLGPLDAASCLKVPMAPASFGG
jgi:hypothetical protein